MDRNEFMKNFWNYYLLLEERFIETIKYVEVTEDNYETYSIVYIGLLQNICSEIDVVLKEISGFEQDEHKTIGDYYTQVSSDLPDIFAEEVEYSNNTVRSGVILKPFENWNNASNPPCWWTDYNKVKHERADNYKKGNLENVLNALAGLYILEMYKIKKIADEATPNEKDIPDRESKIFQLKNFNPRCTSFSGGYFETI